MKCITQTSWKQTFHMSENISDHKKIDQKNLVHKSCSEITIFPTLVEDLAPIFGISCLKSYSLDLTRIHGCKEDFLTQKVPLQLTHWVLIENLV